MDLALKVEVTGVIVPYAFTNSDTGEEVGLVHLRVPGDVVSVNVDPAIANRMREGETWQVSGIAIVRKKKATLHISEPHSFKRLAQSSAAAGPTFDFGDKPFVKGGVS